ncbi:MAG: protein translocase subunit SecD [Phycisphaerales bacterium]|nr:protein translocase subunit SecD [Planctomycetota bacterium]MBL6997855.1 protein translocase subunit SecD [Phycisphaerales bacterium]
MQNLIWKIILIALLLIGCVFAVTPPDKKIRLGRDLSGGVSLIYSVRMDEGVDRQSVLSQTIEVLKERVNPDGVFDIQMTPLGTDRIEVVMPLPSPQVKELMAVYRGYLDDLLTAAHIRSGDLDQALAEGNASALFGDDGIRGTLVTKLQELHADLQYVLEELDANPTDGSLEQQVADVEIEYEDTREQLLAMSLDRNEIARLLQLSPEGDPLRDENGRVIRDATTDEVLRGIAPRDVAFAELESSYPHLSTELGALVDAFDEYQLKRTGFDDPEDLIRMLRGAGVLDFRIAVQIGKSEGIDASDMRAQLAEVGPDNTDSPVVKWFPINNLDQWVDTPDQLASLLADPQTYLAARSLEAAEYNGDIYILLYSDDARSMTHQAGNKWSVTSAYQSADQFGRPSVAFRLDGAGASQMGRMTGSHINEPMAIVLDGQVYTAPNLQSQINGQGQITGSFSQSEIQYLLQVLAAGSLEARLSHDPIAVNIIGPTIGVDNLTRGLSALGWSVAAVIVFMLLYYMSAGLIADFALLANGVLIFGIMALIDGTFTLPGLAGVVLTMGMAVDANVLIYERIREELAGGARDLREAIREGYNKVYSTIIDANLTNLIVCFVLYRTATTEVKGFAVTLSIGIIATLFTSLFVTRVIFELYTNVFGGRKLPMLPTVFPIIARVLNPSVDWVNLRKVFWVLSFVVCGISVWLLVGRGVTMLDTEFRGGVSLTMRTLQDGDSRLLLAHTGEDSVESRVHAIGDAITGESQKDRILSELSGATVLTVGESQVESTGRVVSDGFQIKVSNPPGIQDDAIVTATIVEAITDTFGDDLDVPPALFFTGEGTSSFEKYTHQIPQDATVVGDVLSTNARGDISAFRGGVLILVEDIRPVVTLEDVQKRIDRMRQQPEYARDAGGREVATFGLKRSEDDGYSSIAVAVYDPDMNYLKNNPEVVDERIAANEWELVSTALSQPQSLDQVSSFSSQIAETMKANAIVAVVLSLLGILAYIWFRFGSLRYSLAAIVALVHDVLVTLGALALAGYVAHIAFFSQTLKVEAFQIDLGVIAALLTVIGYSLNDTIVILDRIRENRGKLPLPTQEIVNHSINQTISRTVLTSVTTLIAVIIIYLAGGGGIRPFAFALIIGILVGTYSSVAIAAPLVFKGHSPKRPSTGSELD